MLSGRSRHHWFSKMPCTQQEWPTTPLHLSTRTNTVIRAFDREHLRRSTVVDASTVLDNVYDSHQKLSQDTRYGAMDRVTNFQLRATDSTCDDRHACLQLQSICHGTSICRRTSTCDPSMQPAGAKQPTFRQHQATGSTLQAHHRSITQTTPTSKHTHTMHWCRWRAAHLLMGAWHQALTQRATHHQPTALQLAGRPRLLGMEIYSNTRTLKRNYAQLNTGCWR